MTENTDGKRFTLWAVLCASALVGSTMAAGAWQIARARISDELAQYERSKEWKLPETVNSLRELSAKLNVDIATVTELERLKGELASGTEHLKAHATEIARLRDENRDLLATAKNVELLKRQLSESSERINTQSVEIARALQENRSHTEELAALKNPIVYIPKGEARSVGERNILVGVVDTHTYANEATIQCGEQKIRLLVGGSFNVNEEGRLYVLTMVKVDHAGCVFSSKTIARQSAQAGTKDLSGDLK